jgi:hypothetical protein
MNPQQWRANQKAAWAAGWAAKFGPNWWQSSAARKQVAIAGNRQRGPNMRAGMSLGRGLGVRFDPQMAPEQLRAIKAAADEDAGAFQAQGDEAGPERFQAAGAAALQAAPHEASRLHLAEALFIVSRTYRQRKSKGLRTLWGAMGFRAGPIGGRYVRSGKLPRFQGAPRRSSQAGEHIS